MIVPRRPISAFGRWDVGKLSCLANDSTSCLKRDAHLFLQRAVSICLVEHCRAVAELTMPAVGDTLSGERTPSGSEMRLEQLQPHDSQDVSATAAAWINPLLARATARESIENEPSNAPAAAVLFDGAVRGRLTAA